MRSLITNTAVAFASVALTTGIVAFADPANATTGFETASSAIVRINDLDLRSDAGRSTAERRIRRAVDQVCGVTTSPDLARAQCRDNATDAAKQALDARTAAL